MRGNNLFVSGDVKEHDTCHKSKLWEFKFLEKFGVLLMESLGLNWAEAIHKAEDVSPLVLFFKKKEEWGDGHAYLEDSNYT